MHQVVLLVISTAVQMKRKHQAFGDFNSNSRWVLQRSGELGFCGGGDRFQQLLFWDFGSCSHDVHGWAKGLIEWSYSLQVHDYLRAGLERGFLVRMRKGERAASSFSFRSEARAVALQVELKHDRNMDLAAAAEAIGD
uniref:Uncharacterized protein n=1 Tax=Fagus sylvatica TaxID=28930 RepID=A0A2N9FYA8_FAGSY